MAYLGLKKTGSFFRLPQLKVSEITEPWLYGMAEIGTLKVKNSLLKIWPKSKSYIIFDLDGLLRSNKNRILLLIDKARVC